MNRIGFRLIRVAALAFICTATISAVATVAAEDPRPLRVLRINPSGDDVPVGQQIVFQFDRPVVPVGRMDGRSRLPRDGRCVGFDRAGTGATRGVRRTSTRRTADTSVPQPQATSRADPRIPDDVEAFEFEIASPAAPDRIEWFVDDVLVATTDGVRYAWPLVRGRHTAHARLSVAESTTPVETERVQFVVK